MEKGLCTKCKAPQLTSAEAFRVHNVLTAEELNFFTGTSIYILRELKAVRQLLEELTTTIKEGQDGRNNRKRISH